MGLSVLDASVVIALFDAGDVCHRAAAAEVASARSRDTIVVPATAMSEALVGLYGKGPAKGREMERLIDALGRVAEVTREIGRRAARIRAQRQIKLPDALVLATGQELDAHAILTFDRRWETVDQRVRVISAS
jgi:predicted nucleic acid-binding protein